MKNFNDLEFVPHMTGEGVQAIEIFENGFGVSVVRFKVFGTYGSYTSNETEWELAVIKGTKDDYELAYDTPITDDVMGHLSNSAVSEIMESVQKLPARISKKSLG